MTEEEIKLFVIATGDKFIYQGSKENDKGQLCVWFQLNINEEKVVDFLIPYGSTLEQLIEMIYDFAFWYGQYCNGEETVDFEHHG